MIQLLNASKIFKSDSMETYALSSVDLKIQEREFVSIMGPSGCGKSTLLNILGMLDTVTSGKLFIDGVNVTSLSETEIALYRNQKIGFVFQSFNLIPSRNIWQNVELPFLFRKSISKSEKKEKVYAALEKVHLSHRMKHLPTQLSGGECQRAAIARAIIGNPSVLLADEPTGNLDSKMGHEIMNVLTQLNDEGVTIVMVTHDEKIAKQTKRTIFLRDGQIMDDNTILI